MDNRDSKSEKNDKKVTDNIRYRVYIIHIGNMRKKSLQLQRIRRGKCQYANEPLMVNKWTSKLACIAPARGM